jgi:phosphatidylglycerol:prolipoprotein diacylglycerol transferase
MIPFLELPELVLLPAGRLGSSPLSLKPFGMLVAAGVYLGAWCATRYGRRRGVDVRTLTAFIYWVVATGFVGGHVLDVVFYSPERLVDDPWALVRLWDGLSSFGGFIGGVAGAFAFRLRHKAPVLPYADVVASALPLGWVFGRAGCAVVHDHPGITSNAWFAVAYPGGGRLDLGLIEMVCTIPIALAFLWMQRRAWPWGIFVGALALAYAPLRFALDFLRVREQVFGELSLVPDLRHAGLTPAQWACLPLLGAGVLLLRRSLRAAARGEGFEKPHVPAAFARGPERPAASDADAQGGRSDPRDER